MVVCGSGSDVWSRYLHKASPVTGTAYQRQAYNTIQLLMQNIVFVCLIERCQAGRLSWWNVSGLGTAPLINDG